MWYNQLNSDRGGRQAQLEHFLILLNEDCMLIEISENSFCSCL